MLAAVYEAGEQLDQLFIDLSDSESLSLHAEQDAYRFTVNTTFEDQGLSNFEAFEGLGTGQLSLIDLNQYSSVTVKTNSDDSEVKFVDSGGDFVHPISVFSTSASRVSFSGASRFGDAGLLVETNGRIEVEPGANVQVRDGDLTLRSGNDQEPVPTSGISVNSASLSSNGMGDLILQSWIANAADTDLSAAVTLINSNVESRLSAEASGGIEIEGHTQAAAIQLHGVHIEGAIVETAGAGIAIKGFSTHGAGKPIGVVLDGMAEIRNASRDITPQPIVIEGMVENSDNSSIGIRSGYKVRIESQYGDVVVNGTASGAQEGTVLGVGLDGTIVKVTEQGDVRISATAGPQRYANGIDMRGSHVSTESGILDLRATVMQSDDAITKYATGVQIRQGSLLRSSNGAVRMTSTMDRIGDRNAVFVDDSQVLAAGDAEIEIEVTSHHSGLAFRLGEDAVIGGPDASRDISLRAGTFNFASSASIQTSGSLLLSSSAQAGRLSIGTPPENVEFHDAAQLTQDDLKAFHPDVRRLDFGSRLNDGSFVVPVNNISIADIRFDHPVYLTRSRELLLGTNIDVSMHGMTVTGEVVLPNRITEIDGDIQMRGNLKMSVGSFGQFLSVNGRLDISEHATLDLDWNLEAVASAALIFRSSGVGQFSNQPHGSAVEAMVGATIQYQSNSIQLNSGPASLQTQVVRPSDADLEYAHILGPKRSYWPALTSKAVGDVNADGFDDFVVRHGSPQSDEYSVEGPSELYLVLGNADWTETTSFEALQTDAIRLTSSVAPTRFGSVITSDDLNLDGFQDIVVGVQQSSSSGNRHVTSVIWGRADFPAEVPTDSGADGVTQIFATQAGKRHTHLQVIKDLNDDQYPEIAYSNANFYEADVGSTGRVVIIAGMEDWPAVIDLNHVDVVTTTISGMSDMRLGSGLMSLQQSSADSASGLVVGAAKRGDSDDDDEGAAFVFESSPDFFAQKNISIADADYTVFGFGRNGYQQTLIADDLNHDGAQDLILGRPNWFLNDQWEESGADIYWNAFSGQSTDLSQPGVPLTRIFGPEAYSFAGSSLAVAPDISGDGINDLIIGAPGQDSLFNFREHDGDVWMIPGRQQWPATIHLGRSGDAAFRIVGTPRTFDDTPRKMSLFGSTVSTGDFDGNGQHDLLISAPAEVASPEDRNSGAIHLFSGNTFFDVTAPTLTLSSPFVAPTNSELLLFYGEISEPLAGFSPDDFEFVTPDGVVSAATISVDLAGGVNGPLIFYVREFADAEFVTLRVAATATIQDEAGNSLDASSLLSSATIYRDVVGPDILLDPKTTESVPAIRWRQSRDTLLYDVWIQPLDSSAEPVIERGIDGSRSGNTVSWRPAESLAPGRYRVWVRSQLTDNTLSPWSSKPLTINPELHIRKASSSTELNPAIEWELIPEVSEYRIYVTDVTRQSAGLIDQSVDEAFFSPASQLPTGRYRMWVAGVSDDGFQTTWSESIVFDITPQVIAPGVTQESQPTIQFSEVPGSDQYEIYVSGRGNVYRQMTDSGSPLVLDESLEQGHYRVWVRGIDSGVAGPWSERSEFSVGLVTKVADRDEPLQDPVVVLSWPVISGVVEYELFVQLQDNPQTTYRRGGLTEGNSAELALPDGSYKVWVKTVHANGAVWGAATEIRVAARTSRAPSLDFTGPPEVSMNPSPEFQVWSTFRNADSIEFFLESDNVVVRQTVQGGSVQWSPPTDLNRGEWSWWFRGLTDDGEDSGFLYGGEFNTSGRTQLQMTQIAGAKNRPLFLWDPVDEATEYELLIYSPQDEANPDLRISIRNRTHHQLEHDLATGTYRAWLRPRDSRGLYGAWSHLIPFEIE